MDTLFDPGPADEQPKGDLYRPPVLRGARTDAARNARVRAMYKAHINSAAGSVVLNRPEDIAKVDERLGAARGVFAERAVALGERLRIQNFGDPRKVGHKKKNPRVDAAETQLRQFWEDKDLSDWALCLIEATLCDMAGLALPPCAYQVQARIGDDAARQAARRRRRAAG